MYGLAALRIGYGLLPSWAADPLEKVRQPFNVGAPSVAAAVSALADRGHVRKVARAVARGRALLERGLKELGLPSVPGKGNFVFVPMKDPSPPVRFLLKRGIAVRGIPGAGLRITAGLPRENRRVLAGLKGWKAAVL
jgi:histidinol-phosphate aminotransferase